MKERDALRLLAERTPDELADPAEGRGAFCWPFLGTAILLLLLGLCGCSEEDRPFPSERLRQCVIGIVAAHPESPEGVLAAIGEQSDYQDATIMRAIGVLVERGELERTPRGLRLPTENGQ